MASFGSFEAEREVYSDPSYTVYFARKAGDPVGEYAVKVFRFPATDLEAEMTGRTSSREDLERGRLDSISLQERAAADSALIAAVLERGRDARGVWYATQFYPRSVNKMMSGKVALPRASLEHVVRSIAQGALDFKRVCGRSHGDLRPTNIQVSKTEKLTEAQVALCDPLPRGQGSPAEHEKNDLHSIGVILLQLVRQRPISPEDLAVMVPIAPSEEWVRIFGSDASDWLALCNRLLDPHLSTEHFTLEHLVQRLDELKPKRRGPPKFTLAGAALALVAILLGLWWLRPTGGTVEITSDPPGATILVDGSRQYGPVPIRLKLSRGQHALEARLAQPGLPPQLTNCLVQSGKSLPLRFQFPYGSVAIKSDPPGATILKDGTVIGKTSTDERPFIIPVVQLGPVQYELQLAQREPSTVTGTVTLLQQLELSATLRPSGLAATPGPKPGGAPPSLGPSASTGVLELTTKPVAATIFESGEKELGRAAPDKALTVTLAPGSYLLVAKAAGLDDVPATLQVLAGATNGYTFSFDCGMVDWTSQPTGATVWLGQESRTTPATFVQKPGLIARYVLTAPGFQSVTNSVMVAGGQRLPMSVTLAPQPVSVELDSDPEGATFYTEKGSRLLPSQNNRLVYAVPWGPLNLVASYPMLGSITNHLELKPGQAAARIPFTFDYGTLVLTNLPADMALYEGGTKIGSVSDKMIHQKRGPHLYTLRGPANSEDQQTNIHSGLNYLFFAKAEKSWKNGLGMRFAWIPDLPGGGAWPGQTGPGGWVGLTEVTQGEYKSMDGSNPSVFREGGDTYPVENLTREQAENFCRWLSGADTAPHFGWRYALPSDAQFAAFAGDADRVPRVTNEGRPTSDLDELFPGQRLARIPTAASPNSSRTHPEPVASTRQANQFGLYDVVGNVSEWLAGPQARDNFYAGGSYLNFSPRTVGTRAREKALPKGPNIGFRLVLLPAQ